MAWQLMAAAVALPALQGIMGSRSSSKNAKAAMAAAQQNAAMASMVGEWNAKSIMDLAEFNIKLGNLASDIEKKQIRAVADRNMELRLITAEYNAGLLEKEAGYLYQALDLDLEMLSHEVDKIVGGNQAQFAANGLVVGEGITVDAEIDVRTQEALQKFIMRTNADNNATRILNEAALTRWNGQVEAQTIGWEAELNTFNVTANRLMTNMGTYSQASYDATMAVRNSYLQAQGIMSQGAATSSAWKADASSKLWSGLMNAGGTALKAWGASSPTTTKLPSTSGNSNLFTTSSGYLKPSVSLGNMQL
jgi:hypothetical protein